MGETDRELEQRISERDKLTPSPEVRAGYILNLIKDHNNDITNWDLLCFCSEYLGSQVLVYDWLDMNAVRAIVSTIQEAHYMRDDIPDSGVKL